MIGKVAGLKTVCGVVRKDARLEESVCAVKDLAHFEPRPLMLAGWGLWQNNIATPTVLMKWEMLLVTSHAHAQKGGK